MALHFINDSPLLFYGIVLCVDSKSVLYSLQSWHCKVRRDLVNEIKYLVHCIISKNILVNFCWIPSHCGLYWNEVCDRLAKEGAKAYLENSAFTCMPLSCHELISVLEASFYKDNKNCRQMYTMCPRHMASVIYRLRCNALKTKYVKNVKCVCRSAITIQHILFDCPIITTMFLNQGIDTKKCFSNVAGFLKSPEAFVIPVVRILLRSPIGNCL